jgi:arylsulfatase A-like enzyme
VRSYTANPICGPSRASTFTGRFTSSIRAFSNFKTLTTVIGHPKEADPHCASIIGYSAEWCVEQGRLVNVSGTGTINTALAASGYDVKLYGKMDTGGGSTMLPPGATASGYHVANNADWRHRGPIAGRTSRTLADGPFMLYCSVVDPYPPFWTRLKLLPRTAAYLALATRALLGWIRLTKRS